MKHRESRLGLPAALLLITGSVSGALPISLTEVCGFLTGLLCVWLVVRQSIWNFPVGIANNVFFVFLFFEARLYADLGLQIVYAGLGFAGWYLWLYGGNGRTRLRVGRIGRRLALALTAGCVVATLALMRLLEIANGAAPFLDAVTTALSLTAQFLLTRKYLENWYVWIAADVLYIGLYISRGLYLTSALYAVFLGLCIAGLVEWRRALNESGRSARAVPEAALGA